MYLRALLLAVHLFAIAFAQPANNGTDSDDEWDSSKWFFLYQTHYRGSKCTTGKGFAQVVNPIGGGCFGIKGIEGATGDGSAQLRCVTDEDGLVRLESRIWANSNCDGQWKWTNQTLVSDNKCEVSTPGEVFGINVGKLLGKASFDFGCSVDIWPSAENLDDLNSDCYYTTYYANGYANEDDLTALGRCRNETEYADVYAQFDDSFLKRLGMKKWICGEKTQDKCQRDTVFQSGGVIAVRNGDLLQDPTLAAPPPVNGNSSAAQTIDDVVKARVDSILKRVHNLH